MNAYEAFTALVHDALNRVPHDLDFVAFMSQSTLRDLLRDEGAEWLMGLSAEQLAVDRVKLYGIEVRINDDLPDGQIELAAMFRSGDG